MKPTFVHLHLHTEYSIIDGIVCIEPLIETAIAENIPAIAITDQNNLFGMVKFYRAAVAAGIKPIIGADILLHNEQTPKQPFRCVLLCQNEIGYKNLTRLISRAYTEGQRLGVPLIQKTWLDGNSAGLIALSGGREGDIGHALLANNPSLAQQLLTEWIAIFPERFYLELQRTQRPCEAEYIHAAVKLAAQNQIPVVATNDVRFLSADDFEAHEARVCIHDGRVLDDQRRPKNYSQQQYLKSAQEMAELFADIPEAITNTVEIAKRCNLALKFGENFLPKFPIPNTTTTNDYFDNEAKSGLEKRFALFFDIQHAEFGEQRKIYDQRLQMELDVIKKMGFPGYFLIVADFIRWAKENKIPVGPGRGSGAGSLVAYALGITDLDPIVHDLLFERFLNPERVSMPDFDIDFELVSPALAGGFFNY